MAEHRVVVAAAHARYDTVVAALGARPGWTVHAVRGPDGLSVEALERVAPDWVLFPHWSWRVPVEVYERFRCVIFHMTDVPYGRGGTPLQNLIVRGHTDTVMTAMQCVAEMDAGPVYLKRSFPLHGTAEEILLRAADLVTAMAIELVEHPRDPVAQEGHVTQFARRTPADSRLNGDEPLSSVFDHIRMLDADGYPRAFVDVGDLRFEFSRATRRAEEILADVRISRKPEEGS
jgi:methionyl-tRNA formyltransferase